MWTPGPPWSPCGRTVDHDIPSERSCRALSQGKVRSRAGDPPPPCERGDTLWNAVERLHTKVHHRGCIPPAVVTDSGLDVHVWADDANAGILTVHGPHPHKQRET